MCWVYINKGNDCMKMATRLSAQNGHPDLRGEDVIVRETLHEHTEKIEQLEQITAYLEHDAREMDRKINRINNGLFQKFERDKDDTNDLIAKLRTEIEAQTYSMNSFRKQLTKMETTIRKLQIEFHRGTDAAGKADATHERGEPTEEQLEELHLMAMHVVKKAMSITRDLMNKNPGINARDFKEKLENYERTIKTLASEMSFILIEFDAQTIRREVDKNITTSSKLDNQYVRIAAEAILDEMISPASSPARR